MVDGSPSIYFLDLPVSGNGPGTGKVHLGISDRAIAVIGLGKGGRSYYALNILHPFAPTLKWSIVPDEVAASPTPLFPSSRLLSSVTYATNPLTVMANMGFSSCVPAFGRITVNNQLRDAVFLGGGFSEPQVDANYLSATQGLGRSALALDVYTGEVLAATALPAGSINTVMSGIGAPTTTPGPVGAGSSRSSTSSTPAWPSGPTSWTTTAASGPGAAPSTPCPPAPTPTSGTTPPS